MTILNQTSFGLAGVNIFESTTEQKFALGARTRVTWGDDKDKSAEVVYVKCLAASLNAGYLCELPLISGTDAYKLDKYLTIAIATTECGAVGGQIAACSPCTQMLVSEYGWAFVSGVINLFVGANAAAKQKLYATTTSGLCDDTPTAVIVGGATPISANGGANLRVDVFANGDLYLERLS
jgi:hypothetical protein